MRRSPVLLTLIAAVLAGVSLPAGRPAARAAQDTVGGVAARHVVVFRDVAPSGFDRRAAALGGTVTFAVDAGGFAVVTGLSEASASALRGTPGVLTVERDIPLGAEDVELASATPPEESSALLGIASVSPDDQWNLDAIDVKEAWAAGHTGSRDVSVAILDTGIDTHPANVDLAGLVDGTRSASLLTLSAGCTADQPGIPATSAEHALSVSLGLPLYQDYHSHGTAVAALVASNGVNLAGVNQEATLFSVKVHERSRRNCLSVYLAGIFYAADPASGVGRDPVIRCVGTAQDCRPADVIHLSIPLEFSRSAFPGWADELVNRAVNFANQRGAVLVAAAGNAAENLDSDLDRFRFCLAPHVVCVSSTGPLSLDALANEQWDSPSPETNFGDAIDVAGPGGTGPALTPVVGVRLVCSRTTRPTPLAKASDACIGGATPTWESTGTSFGAAATSGEAAMLASILGGGRPGVIRAVIQQTADDLGLTGDDPFYGKGRINVAQAVASAGD